MNLVSIADAAQLTGRHEKTIRRWIKKQLDTDPEAKEKIVQETIASGFTYKIDKDYLLTHSPTPLNNSTGQVDIHPPSHEAGQDIRQHIPQDPVIVAKDETITLLKEQIKSQQEELNKKNDQLRIMLERLGEQTILLKGYQDKYLLEDPRKRKEVDSTVDKVTGQDNEQYTVHSPEQGRQDNSTYSDTNHKQKELSARQKGVKPTHKQPQKYKVQKPDQPKKKGLFSFLRGK